MKRNPESATLNRRLASVLGAISLLCASSQSLAQTLEGPDSACVGQPLRIEWTGPNDSGDAITVAHVDAPAERFIDSAWTADEDPARLHAPFAAGTYELRYVGNDPREVLVKKRLDVDRCDEEWPTVAVRLNGWQTDFGDQIDREQMTPYGPAGYSLEQVCDASGTAGWALQTMVDEVEAEMQGAGAPFTLDTLAYVSGAPTRAEIERDMRNGRDAICDQSPPRTTHQPFIITYAYCRMAMKTPTNSLDIHVPPGTGNGTMSMADNASREVMVMSLRRQIGKVEELTGQGWDEGLNINGPQSLATRAGYEAGQYQFEYTVGLGGNVGVLGMIASQIKVKNEGTAWISSQAPGIDIARLFYQRLTSEVSPNGGAMSFFGGLINNIVAMLSVGMPLEIDQTTTSSAVGAIKVKGRTRSVITSVELVDFEPEWCNESLMPADYTVIDIDQQLAEAMGGTDSQEMSEAMQEYNDAMSKMTPEQRAMMESMGMGDMMQQAMGGAAAAGNAPGGSGCIMPSSAELTTNDILQSVQRHLEALGYNTGNTNGDASMETTIAISQFQAEKVMDVTGEVTPQLLGVLAAEVDGACS